MEKSIVQPARTNGASRSAAAKPDDLTVIEGIGPKMAAALKKAGIDTFAKLAAASVDSLKAAISAAGMSFSPSLPTWAEQAGFLARGDVDGLKKFQSQLVSGRRA
ncbi:MAG: DUF4332 domain-containing protein [Chloroflexi bacterium]|nr:DUF4332 domain-containing protein [Chloroflexota bacterium]